VPIAKCFPTGGSTTPTAPADPYGEPLAVFDFSTMSNLDMKAAGTYVLDIASGKTTATTATFNHFKAANGFGANGIFRINNGFLEVSPDLITSEFGASYWSANHTPFFALDLRTISATLSADTYFQQHEYELHYEIEPEVTNGVLLKKPRICRFYVGFGNRLDDWDAATVTRFFGSFSATHNGSTSSPFTRGLPYTGFYPFGRGNLNGAGNWMMNDFNNKAVIGSFYNNYANRASVSYSGVSSCITFTNGTASLRSHPFNSGPWGSTITTSSALSPDSTWAGNNSVWLAIGAMRSSYSIQSGGVPFRISKMTIYERRFA